MKVIMVHSYKGGSGKSLISINFANLLHKTMNKRVLVIESDFDMPSFQGIFDNLKPDVFYNHYITNEMRELSHYIYKFEENLDLIFCSEEFLLEGTIFGSTEFYSKALRRLKLDLSKLEYDYVIIDASPGFHMFNINYLTISNDVIILMRPDLYSYRGMSVLLENIYKKAVRLNQVKLHLIINQIPVDKKFQTLIEEWVRSIGAKFEFLGRINSFYFSADTALQVALGNVILPEDDPTSKAIEDLLGTMKLD